MAKMSIAEALRQAIREEMQRDERVFCIGEDIGIEGGFGGAFTVTLGLSKEFGHDRIRDTPISEIAIAGVAIGAAMAGMRPIADVQYGDFLFCMMDQLCNQAAKFLYTFGGKQGVPIVIRTAMGGYIHAAEQHSQCFENWFVHVPGLKVVVPSTPYDAKGLLKTAINDPDPVIFVEHKYMYPMKGPVPEGEYFLPFGVADIKKPGKDITVIATSYMVHLCLNVAARLEKEDISVEVIDPMTLVPLDEDRILSSVEKTGKVVIVHEAVERGGWGGEMAAIIADKAFAYLDAPVKRVGARNAPVPFPTVLEEVILPTEARIEGTIRMLL